MRPDIRFLSCGTICGCLLRGGGLVSSLLLLPQNRDRQRNFAWIPIDLIGERPRSVHFTKEVNAAEARGVNVLFPFGNGARKRTRISDLRCSVRMLFLWLLRGNARYGSNSSIPLPGRQPTSAIP